MEYTKTLIKKLSRREEVFPEDYKLKTKLNIIHCPYCIHQAFYGIIIDKKKDIIISFRCEKRHQGEMKLLEFFWRNEKNNIYEMTCEYCNKKVKNSIYCEQCKEIFCSKEPCLSEHNKEKHNQVESLLDMDSLCHKHNKLYEYYCEICDVPLCEKCPSFHVEHTVTHINKPEDVDIDNIKNLLEFNEEKLENVYDQKLKYKHLKKKIEKFENIQKPQIHYIKSLLYSINNCNRITPELFLNINNLKMNKLIIKEDTLIEDILESYNLIEPYSIKFKDQNKEEEEDEENEEEEEENEETKKRR